MHNTTKNCPYCGEEILAIAIKCKHCGSDLSLVSSQNAVSEAKPKTRPQFIVALILVVSVVGAACIYFALNPNQPRAEQAPRPVIDATAAQLMQAYDNNEVAADQQFAGALVQVSGQIKSIDKDFTDQAIIILDAGDYRDAIFALVESDKPKVGQMRKGQTVTVLCEQMRRVLSSPRGDSCEIVTP